MQAHVEAVPDDTLLDWHPGQEPEPGVEYVLPGHAVQAARPGVA